MAAAFLLAANLSSLMQQPHRVKRAIPAAQAALALDPATALLAQVPVKFFGVAHALPQIVKVGPMSSLGWASASQNL